MKDLWNNTCVLINKEGNIFLSDPKLRGHNQAISYCANSIGLDLDTEQPMTTMLEKLTDIGNIILLNAGKTKDKNGNLKRNGYLALPSEIQITQQEEIEILKMVLDEYENVTVWKLENHKLKTKSFGEAKRACFVLDELLTEMDINENHKII